MTLNEDTIRELLEQATPGPWHVARLDLHRETGVIDNEHAQSNQRLAALAPELAADWLRMREALEKQLNGVNLVIAMADMIQPQTEAQQTAITLGRDLCDDLTRILNGETNE